jgi:hypothetical protein
MSPTSAGRLPLHTVDRITGGHHLAYAYPGLAVSFVAEFGLTLWLLIKGTSAGARMALPAK